MPRPVGVLVAMVLATSAAYSQTLRELTVLPAATDPAITQWAASHVVIVNTDVPTRPELVVYMHGLGGTGGGARELLRTAAREGFAAIGLTYACDWAPFTFCSNVSSECYESLRREILDGEDRSPHIAVSPTNSVAHRLTRLLQHLDQLHPDEGWSRWLLTASSAPRPDWRRIVVWGHSQGGANVSMLARHEVLGGVCLSGHATDYVGGQPATWWNSHLTPADRYFGFCHTHDQLSAKVAVWALQGLDDFGAVRDVAVTSPPFDGSHQLSSSVAPAVAGQYHNSVVADAFTPRDGAGTPIYGPVWRTMLLGTAAAGRCRGDFNQNGHITLQDLFDLLAAYFAGDHAADVNQSATLSVQDIFDFLAAYFAGC